MAGTWRIYEVYQPRIERYYIVNAHKHALKYNHDSSIAWFRDRWFCLWNANRVPFEGRPGQLIYMSTSYDGCTWSPPEPAFSSAQRSVNPIPCPNGTQWQPNLIVVDGELWAVWSQRSRDEYDGCYVSRLSNPDGKWVNQRLEWDGSPMPKIEGKRWRLFPTQNPIQLRSGRILAPITMIGPLATDAPPMLKGWWALEKRNSVLYSDDGGKTWHVSSGAMQSSRSWAQWEPTVWELPNGTVMMFARNNDFRSSDEGGPRPEQMLLWSVSTDGGVTWTPHKYVPLQTVSSRMHVLPIGGNRFVMVHNDFPSGRFVFDRYNIALFFNRGGGINFVPGVSITGEEPIVAYPQMWIRGNAIVVSYSQGNQPRSIKVAHVMPLPDAERYYLFPRSNLPPSPAPKRMGEVYRFNGQQHIATRTVVELGEHGFSAGAWIRPESGGVLLDTRSVDPRGGFVWALDGGGAHALQPFVYLWTRKGNIMSSLRLQSWEWNYVGLTVDVRTGIAMFYVNGDVERIAFTVPVPYPLRGTTGYIGAKRFERSRLPGLIGEIRWLAVYPSLFNIEEHNWLYNMFANAFQRPKLRPAIAPSVKPTLCFNPADVHAFRRDFALPDDDVGGVELIELENRKVLLFRGEGSVGVDLDENHRERGDRVELQFRFGIVSGDSHILCTIGDANEPARLIERLGKLWLVAGSQEAPCGEANMNGWTTVKLISADDRTIAIVNDGQFAMVHHNPIATWVYLGQGYPTGAIPPASRFMIDVASVRSRVVRKTAR